VSDCKKLPGLLITYKAYECGEARKPYPIGTPCTGMDRRDKSAEELSVAFDGIEAESIDTLEDLQEEGLSVTDRTRTRSEVYKIVTYGEQDKSREWHNNNTFKIDVHKTTTTGGYKWAIRWGPRRSTHEDCINWYTSTKMTEEKQYGRPPTDWICEQVYELIQTLAE